MPRIFIQPLKSNFDSYEDFATKNGFNLEIIDFAYPHNLDSKYLRLVRWYKSRLKNNKKLLAAHGAYIDIYINSPDPAIRKVSEDRVFRNLDIAKQLGIKYVIFHTNSFPMIGWKSYYQNWIKAHVNFWKKVLKKYKITVLLENVWDKDPDLIAQVVHKVNSKYLQVCFDTGHCNVFSEAPLDRWFQKLGKHIAYIHINDNKGDKDSELPPGKGNINWKRFNRLVKKYCDNPHATIEVEDLNQIKESINYLKKNNIYPFSK